MQKQAGVIFGGVETKLVHAFRQMFPEKTRGRQLPINGFVHLQNDVSVFHALGTIVLWQFHAQWLISWLWALAEGQGEIHMS